MRIRDHWNRIVRKSNSSASSSERSSDGGEPDDTNIVAIAAAAAAAITTPAERYPMPRPMTAATTRTTTFNTSSRLAKRFTSWRPYAFNKRSRATFKGNFTISSSPSYRSGAISFGTGGGRRATRRFRHPSERPMTEQNLRHQKVLGNFTMKFGNRHGRSGSEASVEEISPLHSRPVSMDHEDGGFLLHGEEVDKDWAGDGQSQSSRRSRRRSSSLVGAAAEQERMARRGS